jgi:hypothetical protein
MKRLVVILALATLLTACLAATAGAVTLVFEAEHYTWIKPSMRVGTGDSNGPDSGGHIYIPLRPRHGEDESGPADDGNATYKVYVPVEGNYTLWGLVRWYDGCGNSFYVMVDDMNPENPAYITDARYQQWHWVKGRTYHLGVGYHLIRFQYREDGAKLDEFLITTAEDFVPTRHMPETSAYLWRPSS